LFARPGCCQDYFVFSGGRKIDVFCLMNQIIKRLRFILIGERWIPVCHFEKIKVGLCLLQQVATTPIVAKIVH
jgi:hypothetical protein